MALSIPLWAVVVAAVGGFLVLLAILLVIRQCRKIRARKQEEIKAAEEFPPMRKLTIRRGQVVPVQNKRWSGIGSSIFGDRRSHRSRFSSVTDLEKAETSRSRSPFGIWPSSSYQAQQDGPSNELSSNRTKRTSTREGNMEFLRDVDRKFLRQLPTAHERESRRKSRMSERSNSIPSIINARQFAEESHSKRPSTSRANTDTIEEIEEPDSFFPSPDPNHSPIIYAQSNNSQDSLPSPTGRSFSRSGNHMPLPKSKFSSARLRQWSEPPAIPSPLSKSQSAFSSSSDSPINASTSLPATPRSLYSPHTPRLKEKSRLINQSHASNSTPTLPTTATAVIRKNGGISKKSPSPYGTVSTTISATNPMPTKDPRSRSKSRSPTRKSRSLSRSRSRTKSTLSAAPFRSQSRSKSRGRSPHPNTPTETDTPDPKLSAHLPAMNPLPASPALRSPYHFPVLPTNSAGASSHSLSPAATRSNLDLRSLSFSDISSTFTMGQAQPQRLTILSPTAIGSFPTPPRSPDSAPPRLPDKDDKGKALPRLPSGILPAVQPGPRPGDDVVMGVARSHSKKGRVLRKQSRKELKETQKEREKESVDKDA
jgi:hypothetical protein